MRVRERLDRMYARGVLVEIDDVGKRFRDDRGREFEALRGVSARVHRREFLSVVGASGCGKSTLARMLSGLDRPTSGAIRLDGQAVTGPGRERGMVFQGYTLFPWLTVKQNVMFGLRGAGRDEADRTAMEWLEIVGLAAFASNYPHQLSGGMKQRVAIARALATHPRLLLMDEPFAALDPATRERMQFHLLELWRNVDITIVFITHDLDEAILLSDRILVLRPNPGQVEALVEVPLVRPRDAATRLLPEFLATRRRLDAMIVPARDEGAEPVPRVPRLTHITDDIE
jgi:NitT/TauT family transport system ATP-binding protein